MSLTSALRKSNPTKPANPLPRKSNKIQKKTAGSTTGSLPRIATTADIESFVKSNSSPLNPKEKNLGIIMAGGHGKRIKSSLPKVAHLVWGKPSAERVLASAQTGLKSTNQIVIVGRKAEQVVKMFGKKDGRAFAYQAEQLGTGHAVQVAVKLIPKNFTGNVYIFPGDAGLIDSTTIQFFKKEFEKSKFDMMMLTGQYEGAIENNYYGRIVRVPKFDINKNPVPTEEQGQVIAIIQHQDILSMKSREVKAMNHRGKKYSFTKEELLHLREFDSVIFAMKFSALKKHIHKLSAQNNIQKEFYLTDLVELFNRDRLMVGSVTPPNHQEVLLGFNDKTVLRKIETIYRSRCFEKIKNILDIEDHHRFFIADDIVAKLIRDDKKFGPLDIFIGGGAYLKGNITLGKGVSIGYNSRLEGNIIIKDGVKIGDHVVLSNWQKQAIVIEEEVHLNGHNNIKGNVTIKQAASIGSMVNITGNNEYPTVIGARSEILGSCYLFGCRLAEHSVVESSVLIRKKINCVTQIINGKPEIRPVRYVLPTPQGAEQVHDIN